MDILWNGSIWEAAGPLEIDAMGESADWAANGLRIKLSGVDQAIVALIHGSRWRGRPAVIWHAGFSQPSGSVLADPVELFRGPMNGGWQIGESRGDFGGGRVDITTRLTSRLDELVKVRGIRCNEASHRSTVPGASTDTFFQNVPSLMNRRAYWGVREPSTAPPITHPPITETPSAPGSPVPPWGGPSPGQTPWPNVPGLPPPSPPPPPPMTPWPGVG